MERLAQFILKTPLHSVLVALFCAFFPGLFLFALIILALVTLRKGPMAGLMVAVVISAVAIGTYSYQGFLGVGIASALIEVVPIWLLSVILRSTISLQQTVLASATIVAAFGAVLMLMGDWKAQTFYTLLSCQAGYTGETPIPESVQTTLTSVANYLAFMWPALTFVRYQVVILFARWWQSRVFNPGGFKQEFHSLRFDKTVTMLASIVIVVGALLISTQQSIAVAILAAALLSIHGLSIVHWFCAKKELKGWVLIPVYAGLIVFPWLIVPVLVVLSVIDSFYSLRNGTTNKAC